MRITRKEKIYKSMALGVALAGAWLFCVPATNQGGHYHVNGTELRAARDNVGTTLDTEHSTPLDLQSPEQTQEDVRSTPTATRQRNKSRKVLMNVSAYTRNSDECNKCDGITASGEMGVPFRTCAADDLPFGTRLLINGQVWVVQDRFGGGYVNRVDLMMETKDQCFAFGRQYIEVEVLED